MIHRTLIYFFILLTSFISNLYCIEPEKVKDDFKECKVYYYNFNNGKIDINSKMIDEIRKFDNNGNEIESIHYSHFFNKSQISNIYLYKYDDKGNLIEKNMFTYYDSIETNIQYIYNEKGYKNIQIFRKKKNKNNYLEERTGIYKLDNFGREINLIWYQDSLLYSIIFSHYNENGIITEETFYKIDSTLNKQLTLEYKEKGLITESNIALKIMWNYKYDNLGNKIEEIYYNETGSFEQKYTFLYDEFGNLLEKLNLKNDSTILYRYSYKYDGSGNLIEYIAYKLNEPFMKKEYFYSNLTFLRIAYFQHSEAFVNSEGLFSSCLVSSLHFSFLLL